MTDRLKDKVAIVTGAHSGIGLGIADAFRSEGAIVYASDIKAHEASHPRPRSGSM